MNECVSPDGDTWGYVEKTSPMKFSPIITSPMDTESTVEISPPIISSRDKPSDQSPAQKTPPMISQAHHLAMKFVEDPSDDDVRGAARDLLELTRCVCDPGDHGGAHQDWCDAAYRPDVTLLLRRLGVRVSYARDGRVVGLSEVTVGPARSTRNP